MNEVYLTVSASDLDKIVAALCQRIDSAESLMRYHASENGRLKSEIEALRNRYEAVAENG